MMNKWYKMKNKWYKLIGLSFLLVVIGLVLIGIGISKGGETSISFGELFDKKSDSKQQTMRAEVDEVILPFDSLDIDAEAAEITIIKGSEYRIHMPESHNNKVSYEIRNNKLIIKQKEYKNFGFGFIGISFSSKTISKSAADIIVYIPENAELKNLKLECGVGEVEIKQVKADLINVSVGVGTLKMDEVLADTCNIEGGVGEVEVKNLITNTLDVDAGVGEIDIEGTFNGDVTLNGGMGEITLKAKGVQSDFNYKLEKGLGEIKLNNQSIRNMKMGTDNADKTIKVSAGVGSIAIYIE